MLSKKDALLITALTLAASPIFAASYSNTVVAPNCLVKRMTTPYTQLASDDSTVLISTDDDGIQDLMFAKNSNTNVNEVCGGFVDVTDKWQHYQDNQSSVDNGAKAFLTEFNRPVSTVAVAAPDIIKYRAQIFKVINTVNPQYMWRDLNYVVEFPNRYSRSVYGVKAAAWVKEQVEAIIAENNRSSDVTVYFVKTIDKNRQPSVVLKIGGSTAPGIILSAHLDTVQPLNSVRPGADDDGTGTVTVLEAARRIIASKIQFRKPIYLIWYAATENGLLGSSSVIDYFKARNIGIETTMQLDMTGYSPLNNRKIWLITDNTDTGINNSLVEIVGTFIKIPIGYTSCGFACSDNYNWAKYGVASSMPFETNYATRNPSMQTANDTISKLSQMKMTDFAKLGIAYTMEFAQPLPQETVKK